MSEIKLKGAVDLSSASFEKQLRVGIQGPGGSGKSWAATTFPNPVFLSFDRGLIAHLGKSGILEVPFYNEAFVDSICPRNGRVFLDLRSKSTTTRTTPPNRKDALPKWLEQEATKMDPTQTLVVDGLTGIQAAYHMQYWVSPETAQDGSVKPYAEYKLKIDYFTEIMMCLKSLKCGVVFICHDLEDRDPKGNINGQVRPLLSGQFVDELLTHFTDWFRATVVDKPKTDERKVDMAKVFNLNQAQVIEWIASTPSNIESTYLWQTQSDSKVKCKTSLVGAPKFIVSNYSSFSKYQNKQ